MLNSKKIHVLKRYGLFLILVFVLLSLGSMTSYLFLYHNRVDQNCFFTVGRGMLDGLIPYRDLVEQKGPLLYFLHAAAAWISYDSFIGVFVFQIFFLFIFIIYCDRIARLYLPSKLAFIAASLCTLVIIISNCYLRGDNAEEFCMPLLMIGLYAVLRYLHQEESKQLNYLTLFINGFLAGCVLWIKFTLLGFWGAWYLLIMIHALKKRDYRYFATGTLSFLGGMALVFVPIGFYFGYHDALKDLFQVYFYDNIYLYTKETFLLGKILHVLVTVIFNIGLNPLLMAGILYFVWKRKQSPVVFNSKEQHAVMWLFCVLYIGLYFGGTYYDYYFLIASPFVLCGIILFVSKYVLKYDCFTKEKQRKTKWFAMAVCCAALLLMGNCFPYFFIPKENYPQYQFAKIMKETKQPTLLNYGFLDGGFYLSSQTKPPNKFFCELNIPEAKLPEMYESHRNLVRKGQVDYVVTRVGIYESVKDIPDYEIFNQYELVGEATNWPDFYRYYLFKHKVASR